MSGTRMAWVAMVALALLGASGRAALADADDAPPADAPAPKVVVAHGVTTIVLDARAGANAGIVCARVTAAQEGLTTEAMGALLPLADLAPLAARLAGDAARQTAAAAAAATDAAALARARALFADGHNASAATVQAAASAAAASAAAQAAATATLAADRAGARQSLGGVLADAMTRNDATWRGLMAGTLLLARLDVPPRSGAGAPARLRADLADGRRLTLTRLGDAGVASATLRGPGFYYLTPARPGVLPGMALSARFAAGGGDGAVILPQASVVWLQGRAFVYVRTGPGRFTREAVTPEGSGAGDAYVARGLAPGTRVVRVGAQMLLSEEFRAVATAGGDQD